jgi:hypothetical protein
MPQTKQSLSENGSVWFIARDNESKGPFTQSEILEFAKTGYVKPATMVWKEGMQDWIEFGKSDLKDLLSDNGLSVPDSPNAMPPPIRRLAPQASKDSKGSFVVLLCVLGIGIIIGAALSVLFFRQQLSRTSDGLSEAPSNATADADEGIAADSPEGVVKSYLKANKWQDRLSYVRNPQLVRRLMEVRYANVDWSKPLTFNIEKKQTENDYSIVGVKMDNDTSFFALKKEKDGWKIDWPASVQYNPMTVAAYKAQRPLEHYNMRMRAKLSDYYNFEFGNGQSKYYSIQLTGPDDDDERMPYGYIEKKSEPGKKLFEFLKDGEAHFVILKISFLPGSTGDVVLIHRFIASNWIDDEPKLADEVERDATLATSLVGLQSDACKEGAR